MTVQLPDQLPFSMAMYGHAGSAGTVCICGAYSKPHQQAERGDIWGGCDGHGGGFSGQLPRQGPLLLISPWSKGKSCILVTLQCISGLQFPFKLDQM